MATMTERLAETIEASAREQGATDSMIATYTLAAGDLDLVREEWEAAGDLVDGTWRDLAVAVERQIRGLWPVD